MQKTLVGCSGLVLFCAQFGLTFIGETAAATCNSLNGPSGLVECLNFIGYIKLQWATCVTGSYLQQKSKGLLGCRDTKATYCWYPCMMETHNVYQGNLSSSPVDDDCACGSDAPRTIQRPYSTSTLHPWCFSPSGQECSWYKQCLEERYPCEGTSAANAITYAEKFCNLYTDHAHNFSETGQNWTNAVRKCLQLEIVPILRPWVNISCDGIRQMAFNSYSHCYLSAYRGAPSICDLPASDWWKIFWTIKSGFVSAFVDSLEGVIDVLKGCQEKVLDNLENIIKFKFNIERQILQIQNRSTSEELDELAGAVADAIASKLGWKDSGIMWYAYCISSRLTCFVPVGVLITGKITYDLDNTKISNFNLTAVIKRVVKAVQDGDLFFRNIGDKSEPIYVKQMKECVDFKCQRVTQEVTAPPNKYAFGFTNNIMHTKEVTASPNKYSSSAFGLTNNIMHTKEVTATPNKYSSSAFGLTNDIMHAIFTLFFYLIVIKVL